MLPSRIPLDHREKTGDRITDAFLALLGIDASRIAAAEDLGEIRRELEIAQAELSRQFLKVWTGNPGLRIELRVEREKRTEERKRRTFLFGRKPSVENRTYLCVTVRDVNSMAALPLENRSKGFRWFFSFWVWFEAIRKTEETPFILLLDEPGLHLHEDAQEDLLRFMEELSSRYQIIYTTHSPYMLKERDTRIIRLINGHGGTKICAEKDETRKV